MRQANKTAAYTIAAKACAILQRQRAPILQRQRARWKRRDGQRQQLQVAAVVALQY
jgi:hypothetical protein